MTDRLLLRTWRSEDREPFAQMNADPDVMAFFVSPMTRRDSDALVDRIRAGFADRGFGLWAVEELETGRFIGFTGLIYQTFQAPFTPAFEIGYRLARHAWGKGYATEAGREVLRYSFDEAGLAEIDLDDGSQNARSRAVMNKLGLRHDPADDFDHPSVPDGHPLKRHVLYRLTAQRWRLRRACVNVTRRGLGVVHTREVCAMSRAAGPAAAPQSMSRVRFAMWSPTPHATVPVDPARWRSLQPSGRSPVPP